jgi:hypothetical protein
VKGKTSTDPVREGEVSEASANLVYACDQWEIDLGRRELGRFEHTIGMLCGGYTGSELQKAVECTSRFVGVLRPLPAGEIGSVVVASIPGFPEARRAAVALNEIALLVLPGLRGRRFRFSRLQRDERSPLCVPKTLSELMP